MNKLNNERDPNDETARPSRRDQRVEQASLESFPASDPPAYTPSHTGGVDREIEIDTGTDRAGETQEFHDQQKQWASRFCTALSGRGDASLTDLIAEDVAWRAGDGPLLVGPDAVLQWQQSHLNTWGKVACRMVDARGDDQALFIESEVQRSGSDTPSHEAMSVKLRGGRAVRVQLYGAVYDAPQADTQHPSPEASPEPSA